MINNQSVYHASNTDQSEKYDDILETLSPKFNNPTDKPPNMMVKFNHDRNVLSFAKKTLGSTLVGKAIFLFGPF